MLHLLTWCQEHESQSKELEQAKARITTLERDNVELYEKIRYVQSYAGSTSGAAKRAVVRAQRYEVSTVYFSPM